METIKLDLIPGKKMPSLHASQYDDGREHGIDLFENGIAYKLDGTETLTINERKGDDCICSLDIENTFADTNHIVFASTEQMCAVWGNNICELVIAKGEKTIGTLNFILEIEQSPTEGGIESESEIKNLERQIEAITEEVIGDNYYTAEETDEAIATAIEGKADKTYVDEELEKKANTSDVYSKTQTYNKQEVDDKIAELPEPMVFKGTLGVGGTIETLPTASASNEGWMFKCITAGTYAGLTLKVGDTVTCFNPPNTSTYYWDKTGSQDTDTDTWRAIKVNGVEKLGNGISGGAVDFVGSENIEINFDGNGNKVEVKTKNIYTESEVDDIVYDILPDDTASGSVANFETDLALPIKSLEIDVNAKQDLHGYDYPWTAGGGKNKLENTASSQTISGVTFTVNSDGTVSVNGTATEDIDFTIKSQVVFPSGNYILNGCPANGSSSTYRLFATNFGSDVGNGLNFSGDGVKSSTIRINIKANVTISNLLFKPMVRLATITDATYEPYENICPISGWDVITLDVNGTTEAINLGGTYYGGHFTQDKDGHRQFEVTHGIKLFGDISFSRSNNGGAWGAYLFYAQITDKPNGGVLKCSNYEYVVQAIASMQNEKIVAVSTNKYIYIRDDAYTTVEDFKTANANTQVVYPLATPIIIDLPDGEPIITLNGTNNIYADTGDCAVEYKCSVAEYVANHSGGGGAKSLGGVFLGGSNSGSEEEPTEKSEDAEDTEKVKELDEPKEEIKTIGDMKKLGGE